MDNNDLDALTDTNHSISNSSNNINLKQNEHEDEIGIIEDNATKNALTLKQKDPGKRNQISSKHALPKISKYRRILKLIVSAQTSVPHFG